MNYTLIIIGIWVLLFLLFIMVKNMTKILHHYLLIWKYFNKISDLRGTKVKYTDEKPPEFKMEELRYYIMSCLLWHYPQKEIIEACVTVGWDRKHVEDVMKKELKKMGEEK